MNKFNMNIPWGIINTKDTYNIYTRLYKNKILIKMKKSKFF